MNCLFGKVPQAKTNFREKVLENVLLPAHRVIFEGDTIFENFASKFSLVVFESFAITENIVLNAEICVIRDLLLKEITE